MFRGFWGPASKYFALSNIVVWTMYYKSLYKTNPASSNHSELIKANLWEGSRLAYLRKLMFASKSTCTARIPEVKCPVLVVMGTKDPDFKDPVYAYQLFEY